MFLIHALNVPASNIAQTFVIDFSMIRDLTPLHFIRLELTDKNGNLLSDNFYWRNGVKEADYTALNTLPEADLSCSVKILKNKGKIVLKLKNNSQSIAFANRLRIVEQQTGRRVLPLFMPENYITLMPGEEREVSIEIDSERLKNKLNLLLKQYGKKEKVLASL